MWDQTRGAYTEVGAPNLGSFGEWELFNIREVDAGFVGPLRSLRSRPEPKRQPPVSAGLGGEDMFFGGPGRLRPRARIQTLLHDYYTVGDTETP